MKLAIKIILLALLIILTVLAAPTSNIIAALQAATPTATSVPPKLPVITSGNASRLAKLTTISPTNSNDSLVGSTWSPDGKYLALSNADTVFLVDTSDFSAKPREIHLVLAQSPQFSPDGTLLALYSRIPEELVNVYQVGSFKKLYSVPPIEPQYHYNFTNIRFSPDSDYLAINAGDVYLLEANTGKIVNKYSGYGIWFSPDGTQLATLDEERLQTVVSVWDIRERTNPVKITGFRVNNLNASSVAFSPDSTALAVKYFNDDIVVYDIGSGAELQRFPSDAFEGVDLLFSPNGRMLAAIGPGKTTLWSIKDTKSRRLKTNPFWTFNYSDYDRYGGIFNKDGSLLLYWDYNSDSSLPLGNLIRVWSIPGERQLIMLTGALDPEFSPDGTMLATWGESGAVIWAITS